MLKVKYITEILTNPETVKIVHDVVVHGKKPTLKEMQDIVGGYIELVYDDGHTQIICNEEGKLLGLPINKEATDIWLELLEEGGGYIVYNYSDVLVGNILMLNGEARM